jgi:hypothetical protein
MAFKSSAAVLNAMLDAWETEIGTTPVLKFFTGAPPANCAAANSGTELADETLVSNWADAAASAIKALNSTPITAVSTNTGDIGHYRLYKADGTTCVDQGTVDDTGSPDMTIDSVSVTAVGQNILVTAWSKNLTGHL